MSVSEQILSSREMGEADARSVAAGTSIGTLMENAGAAVARFCRRRYAGLPTVVLCGKGNNGGDGAVAARLLAEAQIPVTLALLGRLAETAGESRAAFERAAATPGLLFREVATRDDIETALQNAGLILDAIVGTGFKPPLRGLAAEARDIVARLAVPVLAVDLPSGWDADSVEQEAPEAFRCDAVVTFAAPKLAHAFGNLTGQTTRAVVVADIGTPAQALQSEAHLFWAGAAKAVAEAPRNVNGNKGKFGHVLVVGGSFGKSGAPSMASLAAMRAGAGLVTAAVPRSVLSIVAGVAPELMCTPLAENADGIAATNAAPDAISGLTKGITVLAVGPGLGTAGEVPEFVRDLLTRTSLPAVIDADALNILAQDLTVLDSARAQAPEGGSRTLVLTPHPGEMARLLGITVKEVEADRIHLARTFATKHKVILVLKGWRTLIAHPDGRIAVNTTGNPSMAKGGSGDILTGIVAAMLAQYPHDPGTAVEAAVFLHGLAGDFAALEQDEHTVLATDTVAHLARAFRARVSDADAFTWIAGTATNGTA